MYKKVPLRLLGLLTVGLLCVCIQSHCPARFMLPPNKNKSVLTAFHEHCRFQLEALMQFTTPQTKSHPHKDWTLLL